MTVISNILVGYFSLNRFLGIDEGFTLFWCIVQWYKSFETITTCLKFFLWCSKRPSHERAASETVDTYIFLKFNQSFFIFEDALQIWSQHTCFRISYIFHNSVVHFHRPQHFFAERKKHFTPREDSNYKRSSSVPPLDLNRPACQ